MAKEYLRETTVNGVQKRIDEWQSLYPDGVSSKIVQNSDGKQVWFESYFTYQGLAE